MYRLYICIVCFVSVCAMCVYSVYMYGLCMGRLGVKCVYLQCACGLYGECGCGRCLRIVWSIYM